MLEDVAAGVGLTATQLIVGNRAVKDGSPVPAETIESLTEAPTFSEVTAATCARPAATCARPAAARARARPAAVKTAGACGDPRSGCRTPEAHQGTARSGGTPFPPTLATPISVDRPAERSVGGSKCESTAGSLHNRQHAGERRREGIGPAQWTFFR